MSLITHLQEPDHSRGPIGWRFKAEHKARGTWLGGPRPGRILARPARSPCILGSGKERSQPHAPPRAQPLPIPHLRCFHNVVRQKAYFGSIEINYMSPILLPPLNYGRPSQHDSKYYYSPRSVRKRTARKTVTI